VATLTISNPSLKTGDVLSFSFSGFMHGDDVWVGVVGGGGLYVTADGTGHGAATFTLGESPGTYILEAYDSIGNYTTANFTVLGSGASTSWTLLSTVNTSASNSANLLGWALLSTVNTVTTHSVPVPVQTWVLLSTINTQAIHSPNLLGWVLLSTVNTQAIHSANLLGWVLLSTANVSVVHSANLLGWVLLSTVNTAASHKVSGDGGGGSGGTTPSWLIPAAIVAVALASQQKTKKVGAR
jgi:hypothetical protein